MNVASLHHLQTSLSRVDDLIRLAVTHVQQSGQSPGDALRGLVVSWDEVESHLDTTPLQGLWGEGDTLNFTLELPDSVEPDLPFLNMVQEFELSSLDAYILLLVIAPELDRRYERVYGFLQDDVSQKRATVNLLMNLLGGNLEQRFAIWDRLKATRPLVQNRLISTFATNEKPSGAAGLSAQVKADERTLAHLLGDDQPDMRLRPALLPEPFERSKALPDEIYQNICVQLSGNPLIYFKGRSGLGQAETAATLAEQVQMALLRVDASRLKALGMPFEEAWRLALREARLQHALLMIENWATLFEEETTQPDRALWEAIYEYPRPVIICGEDDWEPLNANRTRRMLRAAFDLPEYPVRLTAWEHFVRQAQLPVEIQVMEEVSNKFRLPREQIARSVVSAIDIAVSNGRGGVQRDDLYAGIQAHISLSLGHLADRIEPRFTWSDLILPDDELGQLHEITARARNAYRVQYEWGFRKRIPNANGVSALFSGESGTGKTLSVQVIANDLGQALYRIDLSAVVSKYIGETEKNLNKIFTEARTSNAILFFDEADAIFGKRSEVKDARDRYANIEIAYLLQQIEDYDGIAIMATNLRQNLDEAFTRRLDFIVDFPFPDADYRARIWAAHFPPDAPLDPTIDLDELAVRYHLAGGNIRNAALSAAYLAASDGGIIGWAHIRQAIRREQQKMGRLMEEF